MYIKQLELNNFRNLDNVKINFEEGINLIHGENGVGKTSIVEAIYYLGNLGSFRTSDDTALIKDKEAFANIDAKTSEKEFNIKIFKDKKELKINEIPFKKYRDYLGELNIIGFCPEDIYLFKDSPRLRRGFLDKEISKIDKKYLMDTLKVNKILKERNKLLKSFDKYKKEVITILDKKLASLQSRIINKRSKFIKSLEEEANSMKQLFEYKYDISLIYNTFVKLDSDNLENEILSIYEKGLDNDIERMVTNNGVHKDDWNVRVNDIEIKDYASQGEQRMMVLIIKLSLAQMIKKKLNQQPILVLDDVLFELDLNKKTILKEILSDYQQTFITSCDRNEYENFNKEITLYKLVDGEIKKEERV